jgi:hypothetical protein
MLSVAIIGNLLGNCHCSPPTQTLKKGQACDCNWFLMSSGMSRIIICIMVFPFNCKRKACCTTNFCSTIQLYICATDREEATRCNAASQACSDWDLLQPVTEADDGLPLRHLRHLALIVAVHLTLCYDCLPIVVKGVRGELWWYQHTACVVRKMHFLATIQYNIATWARSSCTTQIAWCIIR